MFSSFTALLPSALHLNAQPELPRPNINPDTEDEDENEIEQDAPPQPQLGETEERSGKGKDKSANEVGSPLFFIRGIRAVLVSARGWWNNSVGASKVCPECRYSFVDLIKSMAIKTPRSMFFRPRSCRAPKTKGSYRWKSIQSIKAAAR